MVDHKPSIQSTSRSQPYSARISVTEVKFLTIDATGTEELMARANCSFVAGMSVRSAISQILEGKTKAMLSVDKMVWTRPMLKRPTFIL